jgi:hypothetical protein
MRADGEVHHPDDFLSSPYLLSAKAMESQGH